MLSSISRRNILAMGLAAPMVRAAVPVPALKISLMSKFMQFLDVPAMAEAAARLGYDGIDLCVRPGGHVAPERVQQDLPKAIEIIRKNGLVVEMITSSIVDERSPHAKEVLKTASSLGIRYYRWGGFTYKPGIGIAEQLDALKPRVKALAKLNREYDMCAIYHTHSGPNLVGASIWDVWLLVKDEDTRAVAINFDIGHATVEGGLGGWEHSARLALPVSRGIAFKDFRWGKNKKGKWEPAWCPLGEGMVDFKKYLPMVKAAHFAGPVQLHFEYPLGGVDTGARTITIPQQEAFDEMGKGLKTLRSWFKEFQL